MVFRTVRSFGSCLMILSYSAIAACSLPCWTYFSAALRTFALLNPNPSAIVLDERIYASMLPKTGPKSLLSSLLLSNLDFFPKRQNRPQTRLNYHRIATLPIDAEVTNG